MAYSQGDVVLVNFNPAKGEEIAKVRPAILISRDDQNIELDVVIVVPLSSKVIKGMEPFRIFIPKREGLEKDSDALVYHLRAISKKRIAQKIAGLRKEEIAKIKEAICEVI